MHVVILAEFAVASGGAEKVAVESARGLAEAGTDVTFIQAVAGPADPLLDHPRISHIPLGLADVWDLPPWRGALTGIWHGHAAERLKAALDGLAVRPDVIHLHQWTRALSPSIMPVLHAQGVPLALTLHEYFLACPNGLHYRFDTAEPCALKPLSIGCIAAACDPKSRLHKLVRVGRSAAMRSVVGGGSLDVIHVSDLSRARMTAMLDGLALTHHRIDNPVHVAREAPADPGRGDALVYVGRLTSEKGADLVAEAAARTGMPALFVGAGPLHDGLSGMPGVEVLGWREPAEVTRVIRERARAICAPSRWFETGPLTVYEALASGIPVIASIRSGAGEKIVDGVNGYRAEPVADAFAAAAHRLGDPDTARRLGLAAYERYWAAPMSLSAHAQALLTAYRAMLARRGSDCSETPAHPGSGIASVAVP